MKSQEILNQAITLKPEERFIIIEGLLKSLDEPDQKLDKIVDAEDFEFMQNRMHILEGIAQGERAILKNDTYTQTEAKETMKKWLK